MTTRNLSLKYKTSTQKKTVKGKVSVIHVVQRGHMA